MRHEYLRNGGGGGTPGVFGGPGEGGAGVLHYTDERSIWRCKAEEQQYTSLVQLTVSEEDYGLPEHRCEGENRPINCS